MFHREQIPFPQDLDMWLRGARPLYVISNDEHKKLMTKLKSQNVWEIREGENVVDANRHRSDKKDYRLWRPWTVVHLNVLQHQWYGYVCCGTNSESTRQLLDSKSWTENESVTQGERTGKTQRKEPRKTSVTRNEHNMTPS